MSSNLRDVEVEIGDLPKRFLQRCRDAGVVACDLETTGLHPATARIATLQVATPGLKPLLVLTNEDIPVRAVSLMKDTGITKVFHHAVFDVGFMLAHWHVGPRNIACTKIASRLLDPDGVLDHGLDSVVKRICGITLDKSLQTSDWSQPGLTDEQIRYAVNDVVHLIQIHAAMQSDLEKRGLLVVARRCFEFIVTRAELNNRGYADIFRHGK